MKNLLFTFLLLATALIGRENPFSPPKGAAPLTNNRMLPPENLKREEIVLPSSARIVKEIHQDVDGSVKETVHPVNKQIDWHKPLVVTHEGEGELGKKAAYEPVVFQRLPFITFAVASPYLKIATEDRIIEHYLLNDPYRIVLDFDRDTAFDKVSRDLSGGFFTKIAVTQHGNRYRVTIHLDSYYPYELLPIEGGYVLGLQ